MVSGLDERSISILREADGKGACGDIMPHLPILFSLAFGLGAKKVLEIGTRDGCSTLALLAALEKTNGKLVSIDINDCPIARKRIEACGLSSHWHFIKGHSDDVVSAASSFGPFDILFIDANHSYEQCRKDFNNYSKMLAPAGFVALHDPILFSGGVGRVVSELRASYSEILTLPYCNGLTIVRNVP